MPSCYILMVRNTYADPTCQACHGQYITFTYARKLSDDFSLNFNVSFIEEYNQTPLIRPSLIRLTGSPAKNWPEKICLNRNNVKIPGKSAPRYSASGRI